MPVERRLHDPALHAAPAPVDEAHFAEAAPGGGVDVLADDRRDVARRERVEIQRILDRDADGLVYSRGPSSTCCVQ